MTRETLTGDLRRLVEVVQTRQLPFLAAAIAYYAFLSVVPLLIVGLTVATAVAGDAIAEQLLAAVDDFLTPEAASILEGTLVGGEGRGSVTTAGLLVLLWGGLRVFRGLDIAFSTIYGATIPKSLPKQLRDAVLVLVGIALAITATVVISAVITLLPIPLAGVGGPVGLLVVLTAVFYPLYYVFPAVVVTPREAVPGAVFASVGWTVLGTVFGIYTANAGSIELYGVLGGVLLLLVWFYFGGLILLVGAAINVVRSERVGDRQLQQGPLRRASQRASMSEADGPTDEEPADDPSDDTSSETTGDADGPTGTRDPDVSARITQEDIDELRRELDEMEEYIEDRTVDRDEFESELKGDLKRYVRSKTRRGKATGWGPYLVLLYGTVMTLGAFVYLSNGWAILAMLVIWLSTLGLYTLMVIVGATVKGAGIPFRIINKLRNLRG
ncbi:YihY/virulence factor BrkB family protein [Halobacteriaceae archaeon SHR40]|uniref:YihY/virulence factor BrkB family protein n=1 Tax=Halovenus amylolytica TaxID=2500550 RepID=UPI000FE39289